MSRSTLIFDVITIYDVDIIKALFHVTAHGDSVQIFIKLPAIRSDDRELQDLLLCTFVVPLLL